MYSAADARGRAAVDMRFSTRVGYHTVGLEDAEDLVSGDNLGLGDTVGVTKDLTNLGGSCALPGELADLLDDLLGGGLEPRRRSARVGDGRG